ncbi:MAG: hypothetical protein AAFY60_08295, partial [Myxococcota bacterium]
SSIGPLPIDEGTTRVDPVTFERELRQIGDYIRQGYILKRGFRPCEATVLDVQPRGRPIHFQVSLRFACVETGDPNIEVRFANEFPRPHEHVISMSDRDGRAKQYPLNRPYTLRLARGMPGEVMWVFGGAGLRAVFGVAPVLAFFALITLGGLMARPDLDVRFPIMAGLFIVAGIARTFYWTDPSALEDMFGIVPVALAGVLWLYAPRFAMHSALWLSPIVGTLAGAAWINYGWPGNFGLLAWLALVIATLIAFTAVAYLTTFLAEGALNRNRSTLHTILLVISGASFAAANLAAGKMYVSILLLPFFVTAIAVLGRKGMQPTLMSRLAIFSVLGASLLVLVAGVT